MSAALDVALDYIRRDWSPVPVPYKSKKCLLSGWPHLRITSEEAPRYFNGGQMNVGVILGPASHDLVDADMDCAEALQAAPYYLPQTCMFGRASAPAAHWLYYASGFSFATVTRNFDDPLAGKEKGHLCELRVGGGEKGAQTVFPGSTHKETGEIIRWDTDSHAEPFRMPGTDLEARMCRVAAAALIARYWPAEGRRHEAALALGGVLHRGGWPAPEIKLFLSAVCAAAGDEEARDRIRAATDSAGAIDANKNAYGIPTLSAIVGREVVDAVVGWLGLSSFNSFNSFGSGGTGAASPAAASAGISLDPAALHGLAGDFVSAIAPHSESDPLAILMQFLTAFGVCCGRSSYAMAEADRHPPQVWPVLVGASSRGRKGSSWGHVLSVFARVQTLGWTNEHFVTGGLSSGEGVIWQVRDPIITRNKKGEETESDPGVKDKRLLVVEAEFANVLRQFERSGNSLSAVLRNLWDRGNVQSLTKNSPARTTGALVSVIGHITQDELTRYLDRTELANGFANRLLFACVRRSQRLPFGGALSGNSLDRIVELVGARLQDVRRAGERRVSFTSAARDLWSAEYEGLTADRPGIYGAVTARAEAQVLRLSVIYALLDEAVLAAGEIIDVPHVRAALAVWRVCDASAASIFGKALGDPVADEILRLLQHSPLGVTRNDIINHFGRNRAIGRSLALLLQHGLARVETNPTGGRPEERWHAA